MQDKHFNRRRHPTPQETPPDSLATTEQRLKGRRWWPSLLFLLVAAGARQIPNAPGSPALVLTAASPDSALLVPRWSAPVVDATHPAPNFYHYQVLKGDTSLHSPLAGYNSTGTTWGYSGTFAYGYPTALQGDTVRIARPVAPDTLAGPYWVAVQGAIGTTAKFALGPYAMSAPVYVRPKVVYPNPPTAPMLDTVPRYDFSQVACALDSATALAAGIVRLDVRPVRTAWWPGMQQQFCCFGTMTDGRKVKMRPSWNIPYCETQYQLFLAEGPA